MSTLMASAYMRKNGAALPSLYTQLEYLER